MTTIDVAALYPVDDDDITRLHTRLEEAADRDDLLERRLHDWRLPQPFR